jgi:molybdate transport system ATP-binding protein
MLDVSIRRRLGSFELNVAFQANLGVTSLFGRSGSGKSSVVNAIAGLAKPDQGRIAVNGELLFDSQAGFDLAPEKRRIGYVFQDARLFPHLTVEKNLLYGWSRAPEEQRSGQIDHVVELLGLQHLLERRPGTLSGGEKQRVAIGRALLAAPRLLLMDEPLASLDQARKNEVLPYIARLTRDIKIPIVYVSHAMEEVLRLADTLVLLDQGRVVASGPVEDLLSDISLRPLTGRFDAGSVIRATVERHDEEYGLTHLRLSGHLIKVGRVDMKPGAELRLRVHARDVAIATQRPQGISTQNILPALIKSLAEANGHLVDVVLDVGGVPLWAQVTRQARAELGLETGRPVFALIKSLSVARSDMAEM